MSAKMDRLGFFYDEDPHYMERVQQHKASIELLLAEGLTIAEIALTFQIEFIKALDDVRWNETYKRQARETRAEWRREERPQRSRSTKARKKLSTPT